MSEDIPERRHERFECPDCLATPETGDSRIVTAGVEGTTEIWHTEDCPAHTVEQIMWEEGARQAKERDEWAKAAFPAALARVEAAAGRLPEDGPAAPFVAALLELVRAQADRKGGFVTLDRWAELLDRHFPPEVSS